MGLMRRDLLRAGTIVTISGVGGCVSSRQGSDASSSLEVSWKYSDLDGNVSRNAGIHTYKSSILIGDEGNNIHRISGTEGKRRWFIEPGGGIQGLAIGNQYLAVALRQEAVIGYDMADGSEQWQVDLSRRPVSPMWAANDAIHTVVPTGDRFGGYKILALNAATGEELWTAQYDVRNFGWVSDGSFVVCGMVGANEDDEMPHEGRVIACNPDGSEKWRVTTEPEIHPRNPTLSESGETYVSARSPSMEQGGILAYESDGTEQWRNIYSGGPQDEYWAIHHRPKITDAGILAVLDPQYDDAPPRRLVMFSSKDGRELQSVELPEETPSFSPVVIDDTTYLITVLKQDDQSYLGLSGYSLSGFDQSASISIKESMRPFRSQPVAVASESIVAFSNKETVYGINVSQ